MASQALRRVVRGTPLRYKAWLNGVQKNVTSPDDAASVSALATVCDFYGRQVDAEEFSAKNGFEIKWEDWGHIATEGLVDKLKQKVQAINAEEYQTEALAEASMEESEELKQISGLLAWNAALHLHFLSEQDDLLENLSHAKPFHAMDYWELCQMYKYQDCPTRWDNEMGWYMPNNDQIDEDVTMASCFQFQKDYGKVALNRYYFDYMGKHQILATVGKLSQTERED